MATRPLGPLASHGAWLTQPSGSASLASLRCRERSAAANYARFLFPRGHPTMPIHHRRHLPLPCVPSPARSKPLTSDPSLLELVNLVWPPEMQILAVGRETWRKAPIGESSGDPADADRKGDAAACPAARWSCGASATSSVPPSLHASVVVGQSQSFPAATIN